MDTTKLSSKGQIIIPKAVRDAHGWKAGTQFTVEDTPNGVVLKAAPLFKPTTLEDVIGCVNYTGPPRTLAEIDDALEAAMRDHYAADLKPRRAKT